MESTMVEDKDESLTPCPRVAVLAAINGSRKSTYAVMKALVKYKEERILLRLLHVCPTIKAVPTPMGNYIPISRVRPDVLEAYKKDVEIKINTMFFPFESLDNKGKVEIEVMVIEADNVPEAIARVVSTYKIRELVIGESSSPSWFKRALKTQSLSSRISERIPSFCSVYIISKEKVTPRLPPSEVDGGIANTRDDRSSPTESASSSDTGSQTGIPRFLPISSIRREPPLSRSSSSSNSYSLSAFMDTKEDTLRSRSHNSNGSSIAARRTHSSRSWNSDWNASPIYSSLEGHSVAPPTPGTRLKETKH